MSSSADPVILVVEDRDDDVVLIKQGFQKSGFPNQVKAVKDGDEAVAYLRGEGEFGDRMLHPIPDIVVLDLKLPRRDGFQVLQWVRQESPNRDLPIIVLTSSPLGSDLTRAYQLGATSYFVKSLDLQDFVSFAKVVHQFWTNPKDWRKEGPSQN